MGLFSGRKPHSGLVAKERLSNLLMAERLNCSPASLQMLKNDLSAAAGKYLTVEISVTITQTTPVILTAKIPLKRNEEYHVKTI